MSRYRMRGGWLVALAITTTASCSRGAAGPLPPAPPTVEVTMGHLSFGHPAQLPAGRVVFEIANLDDEEHRLVVVPLPDDFPPIREQLAGNERRFVEPQAGIPDQPPGAVTRLAVDLAPGRHAFICYVVAPDGTSHGEMGMASEFRVA